MTTSHPHSHLAATVAANLARARADAGWTQRELAGAIGCESVQVSKWERGVNRPAAHTLAAIAAALGVTIAWLQTDHGSEVTA